MTTIMVRHKVQDYDRWRPLYDEHAATRRAAGCIGTHLFRSVDNPNEIVLDLEWDSVENARKFVASDDLRNVMQRAGVVDQPDIWFLNEAGHTPS